MSCALALIAAFALSPAEAAAQAYPSAAPAAAASTQLASAQPASLIAEPLFAEIASRADSLHARATGWVTAGRIADAAQFRSDLTRLAELDMEGHRTLAARGTDPDLKCMLRGMSEDLTRQMGVIEGAADEATRRAALQRLNGLLDENAAVLRAPSRPPV